MSRTSIKCSAETRERLRQHKRDGETWDEYFTELAGLAALVRGDVEPADAPADASEPVTIRVQRADGQEVETTDLDDPWQLSDDGPVAIEVSRDD